MKENKAIEIRIIRVEGVGFVKCVIVFYKCADLELSAKTILNNRAKGVSWRSFWKWELRITVGHTLWTDEDYVKGGTCEHVGKLDPHFTGERGLGSCTKNKDTVRGGIRAETFDIEAGSRAGWVESVAKGYREINDF